MELLDKELLNHFIEDALLENSRWEKQTLEACIPEDERCKACLLVKDDGVLAGIEIVKTIFAKVDPDAKIEIRHKEGTDVGYGDIPIYIESNSRALFMVSQLVVNLVSRMSGIATMCSRYSFEVEGLPVKIYDTPKSTPLLMLLDQYAVRVGGCHNFNEDGYNKILIKPNHADICGSYQEAIKKAQEYIVEHDADTKITVEVRNLVQLHDVLNVGGISTIRLDGFEMALLNEAMRIIDGKYPVEASGGITLKTVRKVAETGVNTISVGALMNDFEPLDMSIRIIHNGKK